MLSDWIDLCKDKVLMWITFGTAQRTQYKEYYGVLDLSLITRLRSFQAYCTVSETLQKRTLRVAIL